MYANSHVKTLRKKEDTEGKRRAITSFCILILKTEITRVKFKKNKPSKNSWYMKNGSNYGRNFCNHRYFIR